MGEEDVRTLVICTIPVKVDGVLHRGLKPHIREKRIHFISMLTHHILSQYPEGQYYLKKPVDRTFLKHHYSNNYKSEVLEPLLESGLIEVNDSYSTSLHYSKQYSLSKDLIESVINGKLKKIQLARKTLVNRIYSWNRESQKRQFNEYSFLEKEAEMLIHLNINSDILEIEYNKRLLDKRGDAEEYKRFQLEYQKESILKLNEARDLLDSKIRLISGRVYHPLVNCLKEFRKAVVDDNAESYVEIDLRSSQAVFLCKVIAVAISNRLMVQNENGKFEFEDDFLQKVEGLLTSDFQPIDSGIYPIDFVQFWADVFYSDIYCEASVFMLQYFGERQYKSGFHDGRFKIVPNILYIDDSLDVPRKEAKEAFFKDVFFNYFNKENSYKSEYSSEFISLFNKRFPTVFEFNREAARQSNEHKKKSRDLALLLQKSESIFFHQIVSKHLTVENKFNYFIVHDGIYAPKEYAYAIAMATRNASKQYFSRVPYFKCSSELLFPNEELEELWNEWSFADAPDSLNEICYE